MRHQPRVRPPVRALPRREGGRGASARLLGALASHGVAAVPSRAPLVCLLCALLLAPSTTHAQQTPEGSISGRVTDANLQPLAGVEVEVQGVGVAVTDADGRFVFEGVPAGPHRLAMRHLAYGTHDREVMLEAGGTLRLDVRLSRQAIELAPLVVEAESELERRRLTQGTVMREVERPEIDAAAAEGRNLAELLQDRLVGTTIRPARFGGLCLETRGARSTGGTCREVGVILDGVPVSNPALMYTTIPLQDLERVELLSAAEAGARYGSAGAYGMLIIETRRGPAPVRAEARGELLTGFDWSAEAQPYPWLRVWGSSFVGNAVGLAAGFALADHCLRVTEDGSFGLRTRCGGLATVSAGFLSVGLPALTGGLAARWGGSTERSRGRMTPAGLAAAMGLTAGYLMLIHGEPATETAGIIVLTLGVPTLLALSDRVFRSLR